MTRQVALRVEPAEVDDALHTRRGGCGGDRLRGLEFGLLEVAATGHGVRQVVDHVDIRHRRADRLAIGQVALGDLDGVGPRNADELVRVAHEDAHVKARLDETGGEATADVSGGSGDQGAPTRCGDRAGS